MTFAAQALPELKVCPIVVAACAVVAPASAPATKATATAAIRTLGPDMRRRFDCPNMTLLVAAALVTAIEHWAPIRSTTRCDPNGTGLVWSTSAPPPRRP